MRCHRLIIIAASIVFAGCTSPPAARMAEPERSSLTVRVPGPLPAAFSRLQAAWIQSGLVVASSDAAGGNLTSAPVTITVMGFVDKAITYRANSVVQGDSVDVVLSATARNLANSDQELVSSRARGPFVQVWDRIEAIAAALHR